MLPEEKRRMLKYGMRTPLSPLLTEQICECDRLVKEGLMTLSDEGYVTTEAGRRMYDMEMRHKEQRIVTQSHHSAQVLHTH